MVHNIKVSQNMLDIALYYVRFYIMIVSRYIKLIWIMLTPEYFLRIGMDLMVAAELVNWGIYEDQNAGKTFWFIYFNSDIQDDNIGIYNVADLYKIYRMKAFDGIFYSFGLKKKILLRIAPLEINSWSVNCKVRHVLFDNVSLI